MKISTEINNNGNTTYSDCIQYLSGDFSGM